MVGISVYYQPQNVKTLSNTQFIFEELTLITEIAAVCQDADLLLSCEELVTQFIKELKPNKTRKVVSSAIFPFFFLSSYSVLIHLEVENRLSEQTEQIYLAKIPGFSGNPRVG